VGLRHCLPACGPVFARLVIAGHGPQTDIEAVPEVDGRDGGREHLDFFLGKLSAHLLIDLVRYVPVVEIGDGLGPGQRGALPVVLKGCFPPGVQAVDALFGFSRGP